MRTSKLFVVCGILFSNVAFAGPPTPMGPTVKIEGGETAEVSCEAGYEISAEALETARKCGSGTNTGADAKLYADVAGLQEELAAQRQINISQEIRITAIEGKVKTLETRVGELEDNPVPVGGVSRGEVEEMIAAIPAPVCDCPEAPVASAPSCTCPEGLSTDDVEGIVDRKISEHAKTPHGGSDSSEVDGLSAKEREEVAKMIPEPGTTTVVGNGHVATFGAGVYLDLHLRAGMPASDLFPGMGPVGLGAGVVAGIGTEGLNSGSLVLGHAGLSTTNGYDLGSSFFLFHKGKGLAYGGGASGGWAGYDMYGSDGIQAKPGAYHAGGSIDGFIRITLGKNEKKGRATYLILDPYAGLGVDAISGTVPGIERVNPAAVAGEVGLRVILLRVGERR